MQNKYQPRITTDILNTPVVMESRDCWYFSIWDFKAAWRTASHGL